MDEFVSFNESFVFALVAILLLMAVFGCAVMALDHWVGAGPTRGPSPSRARLS
jgi:hypothetical protein